jgi:acyl carrier protein
MNEIKDKILQYIIAEYGEYPKENRIKHYSYCLYPEEECSCKYLKEINYDTSLIRGGFVDSFEMVSVLVFVESTFNVRIPDKDAVPDNFDTVTKIANLVIKHKK